MTCTLPKCVRNAPLITPRRCVTVLPPRYTTIVRVTPYEAGLIQASYIGGKSVILFTMFYCGLNWFHYRNMRITQDQEDDKNKKDNRK